MRAEGSYTFTRRARSPRAIGFVVLWWLALALLYFVLEASPVILLVLSFASLPALYDLGKGTTSELSINEKEISWRSGRRAAKLERARLKSARLDTRLDLSLRLTLITHQGGKLRLPYECVPPANDIEAALNAHGIPYERHHFTLLS